MYFLLFSDSYVLKNFVLKLFIFKIDSYYLFLSIINYNIVNVFYQILI